MSGIPPKWTYDSRRSPRNIRIFGVITYVAVDVEEDELSVGISFHTGYTLIDFEPGFEPPF